MKHKLIINTLLLTILCGCSNTVSSSDSQISASSNYTKPESFKVYDVYLDEGYPSNKTFVLEEFEDQSFYVNDKSKAITNNTYGTVMGYCSAVYVFDANNDGYRDFCTVKSDGSGVIYWYVSIYDLHNNKEIYRHWERLHFSYFLNLKDNDLFVRQVKTYFDDETINEGKLSFNEDKGVYIDWNKNYDIADFDVTITLANPKHTPVAIKRQKDGHHVTVDDYSLYMFEIDIHSNVDYGDKNIPVSFAMAGDNFSVDSAIKIDKTQRYIFSFPSNQDNNYITHITVSNITKTFIFNKEKRTSYLNLGDIVSWSKDVNLSNLNMLKIQTELTLNAMPSHGRSINVYRNQKELSQALDYFNTWVFEVSPEDFGFLTKSIQVCEDYYFYTNKQVYSYKINSQFVQVNDKWYRLRSSFIFEYTEDYEKYYAFPSNTMNAAVYDASNDSQTDKTINYLSDLIFTEGSLDKNSTPKAKYYFVIDDYKYFIVSSKIFFEVTSNSGHLYTITGDKDFSDLF